jgi:biopolymer transport protein ExbD
MDIGWTAWANTRTWDPLDVSISLSRGHIRTNEFAINLQTSFVVQIEVERKSDSDLAPCLLGFSECAGTSPVLRASWVLSSGGEIVAQGKSSESDGIVGGTETMAKIIGFFHAPRNARYVLDLDVLDDSSGLNAGHPRLQISEWSGTYPEYDAYHFSVVFGTALFVLGAVLLVRSVSEQIGLKRETTALTTILSGLHSAIPIANFGNASRREKRGKALFACANLHPKPFLNRRLPASLPTVGLVLAFICTDALFLPVFMMMGTISWHRWGIMVHVLRLDAPVASDASQPAGILVRVDAKGHYYLDSRQVELTDLPEALEQAFRTRPDRYVYLDGDPNIPFVDAARAMAAIRKAHGDVILLTPGTKSALQH